MDDEGLTLQQIAQRAVDRNGGAAGRALDRAAKRAGLTLSYTTVDKILAGTYRSTPKDSTLEALAQLAGVPRETVYAAARRPLPQGRFADQLPPGVDTLTAHQREAVLTIIRQFVRTNLLLNDVRNALVHSPVDSRVDVMTQLAGLLHDTELGGGDVISLADWLEHDTFVDMAVADGEESETSIRSEGKRLKAARTTGRKPGLSE